MNGNLPDPTASAKQSKRLKVIGIIVMLLGIGCAGFVYWRGTQAPDWSTNPAMMGYSRNASRQVGQLYGKMGLQIDELLDDLKRPGTEAFIIVALTVLITWGLFSAARPPQNHDE